MPDFTILITQPAQLNFPASLAGWLGLFVFAILVLLLNLRWKNYNQSLDGWRFRLLVVLLMSVPVVNFLLPSVYSTFGEFSFSFPIFSAVPWFFAAGLLGPAAACGIAFLSGIIISIWGGGNQFFPFGMALLGTWLGWMFYQQYRTPFYRGLRHPIIASISLIFSYPLLYLVGFIITSPGSLSERLTIGSDQYFETGLSIAGIILIGGIISEFTAPFLKTRWGAQRTNLPSPAESRLSTRFLLRVVPLLMVLLGILIISAWYIAGRTAREMLAGRMASAAEMTAQGIPFFLETGQSLLLDIAIQPLFEKPVDQIQSQLASQRRGIPYFSQLIYLTPDGNVVASDPENYEDTIVLSSEELNHLTAAAFVPIDIISIAPEQGKPAAILSFIAGVKDQEGQLQGILIGRSDLAVNPFAKPLITSIGSLSVLNGEGMLVDENGYILYHVDPDQVMSQYQGGQGTSPKFFEASSPSGKTDLVYYYPVRGKPWSVIISVPSDYIQEQAIRIALPLLGIITILVLIGFFIFRYGLRSVTNSLEDLALQANRMSQGKLDQALEIQGQDEVGELRDAFEKMRSSLKSRIDELSRLLFVSQGIASNFDLRKSLERVLESSLDTGACSARIYLIPSIIPDSDGTANSPFRIGAGNETNEFAYLDEQVSSLTERQGILKLNNLTRPNIFSSTNHQNRPQALLSIALSHEKIYHGVLWIAFNEPHQFNEEEVRYISTLAGQAALAAANSKLFLTTEIARKRMTSILNSTPDPVFVTDQDDHLVLYNSAAQSVFNLFDDSSIGQPISETIRNDDLMEFLHAALDQEGSKEIIFQNGKTYLVTVSGVEVEQTGAGKVCVMRDVSSIKELNSSKSDFVSTVSHDLRSPLALIQGYTSMLQMVGELNEQQIAYLKKITAETEKISHLVTNLLDLGRIEADIGLHLEKKPVQDVVERVVAAAKVQADQKRIKLSSEFRQSHFPSIEADQALLQQALYNLVDNAIKFTDSGGEIVFEIQITETQVTYIVKDNGIGISPADQQNLFEKFFRASTKNEAEFGGSGLGLAIVKSIVEKHSGSVRVESQLGVGSTFYLELPLQQD